MYVLIPSSPNLSAPVTAGGSLALTAAGVAATTAGVVTGIVSFSTFLAEQKVTNRKLKLLQAEHEKAGKCIKRMSKLGVTVFESYEEVGQYTQSDDFATIMTLLTGVENLELKEDIDFIVESYTEAFLHLPIQEAQKELAKVRARLNEESQKKKEEAPGGRDISGAVKGPLKEVVDCGLTKAENNNFDTNAQAKAVCVIGSGVLNELFKAIGVDPGQAGSFITLIVRVSRRVVLLLIGIFFYFKCFRKRRNLLYTTSIDWVHQCQSIQKCPTRNFRCFGYNHS